jgi:hypothetical protein
MASRALKAHGTFNCDCQAGRIKESGLTYVDSSIDIEGTRLSPEPEPVICCLGANG